jgi:hypothetical protein
MKPILLGLCALLLTNTAAAQEVTLKAVTAFAENTTYSRPFERFINRVNEDGKGILRINYIGGPKAMPPLKSAMRSRAASSTSRMRQVPSTLMSCLRLTHGSSLSDR